MKTITTLFNPAFGPGRRVALMRRVRLWLDLWSERRMLARLDERALADLGLTPAEVSREANRPPWDVPGVRW